VKSKKVVYLVLSVVLLLAILFAINFISVSQPPSSEVGQVSQHGSVGWALTQAS